MAMSEVMLPGVGLRYEFTTRNGDHLGLIARRDGYVEVVRYDAGDPDECEPLFRLTTEEAEAVAEIFGAPRIAERFADLSRAVPGLDAGQVDVPAGSRYAGRRLGDTRARTRTGASIVAVVRGKRVLVSPGPADTIEGGDVLVVIGTEDGIARVRRIIEG
ncbi:potassium transporter TrkA [Actinoplanes awajinensis subsp. mycoplanecinus]|uniref:Potassium transporter TrkA n=1 Tax=Actinoplanes awajinensis subsp. mycoplanecinus TaxID=135947 RepID=A0A101JBY4_9ACTN|nr:potassium transporter TrkA [Actinoplanes awajinensis subsp. mycoplanecinus]